MQEDDIMLLETVSGKTVVAEAQAVGNNSLQLTNPVVILQVPNEAEDRMNHVFVPYAPFAENKSVLISSTTIEYIGVPLQTIRDQYRQMVTGIVLPQTKSIITA